jgi:hypothetical protein
MTLRIADIGGGFAIDDGAGFRLTRCPCCNLPFTRKAAEALLRSVATGKLTEDALRLSAEIAERLRRGVEP